VWQVLREELHPRGLEIVTVGLDTGGAEACREFIEAAHPSHPSLIDVGHVMAERFGVTNIPSGLWIDEGGMIVRPAEPAFAPQLEPAAPVDLSALPGRIREIFTEAGGLVIDRDAYIGAVRDWVANGNSSRYVLRPDQVIERSAPRGVGEAEAAAHFDLGQHLWRAGRYDAAVRHFRETHRLQPENIAYKRQAWRLAATGTGDFDRFWQGPVEGREDEWPYEGDWLSDVRAMGAENYYRPLDF
jgi:hypothetical protein